MKKILALLLLFAVPIFLTACLLPLQEGILVISIEGNAQRPPFNVRMEVNIDRPGVFFWYGPWGMDSTKDQNWYECTVEDFENPMMFDAEWTNGVDTIDPEPQFITFDNGGPFIVRQPKFSTASSFDQTPGRGIYLRDLLPGQFYIIDFTECAADPDGDKVTVVRLEFTAFHKAGYVPPQFGDAYPEILQQWEDGDFVDEGPTPYFVTPVDNGKIQWNGVEGFVGHQPRWPEIIPKNGNGLPYAPFRFQTFSQYPFYSPACDERLFDQDTLPTGGLAIRALFTDGSLETWGEWIFLVGPTIGCN